MELSSDEFLAMVGHSYCSYDLVDILDIPSEQFVERFSDVLLQNRWKFHEWEEAVIREIFQDTNEEEYEHQ